MPKVTIEKSHSSPHDPLATPSSSSSVNGYTPSPQTLKRNQACHQCRKRKLKCDAKRPCSTCLRSLAHAKAHPQPGVFLPETPDCTYDDPAPPSAPEPPKPRYEKLDTRLPMGDLESILSTQINQSPPDYGDYGSNGMILDGTPFHSSHASPSVESFLLHGSGSAGLPSNLSSIPSPSLSDRSLTFHSWPRSLPSPGLMRHLIECFFAHHPHATRLFHQPTFMTSLTYPPSHPSFPTTAVLHAICGIGSMYTAAVAQADSPGLSSVSGDDTYKSGSYSANFTETHIKIAKREVEENVAMGQHLLQSQQAQILVAWWYWCNAKWVEVYMIVASIMRACLPLGLHVSRLFKPIADGLETPTLLPPPDNDIEAELRRNIFWLAYALERLNGCGNGWPLSIDDLDVSQLLPVNQMSFSLGVSWPAANEREHPHTKDLILNHNPDQVDGFNLFVKSTILLSRAKNFNIRYAARKYNGDVSCSYTPSYKLLWEGTLTDNDSQPGSFDPRRTAAFLEIQRNLEEFRSSFPLHLRNPMANGTIDSHLYVACLVPHVALIILHDPHAYVERTTCQSAANLLRASRAILELLCEAESTSFDLGLLDYFCSYAWYIAGRSLTRFWQAAIIAQAHEQVRAFGADVEYITNALYKAGERVPLAMRYGVMLADHASKMCGVTIQPTQSMNFACAAGVRPCPPGPIEVVEHINIGPQTTTIVEIV
ncbi:hypothetical protein PENSPDRAFT_645787 [Peniophora sp. CONT]|nr:hypothetical protein PENSPDRAFT_645787 [Peniophora sp. CONT]